MDPLLRIQEEIKEVVRREKEYRQLSPKTFLVSPSSSTQYEDSSNTINQFDDNLFKNDISLTISPNPSLSPSTILLSNTNQNASEGQEDQHSDDSGVSSSSSPTHRNSSKMNQETGASTPKEKLYIGSNCYNLSPELSMQKLTTKAVSVPQHTIFKRQLMTKKGVMERFIASRGKLNNFSAYNTLKPNIINNIATSELAGSNVVNGYLSPDLIPDYDPSSIIISTISLMPPAIERDENGKLKRPGYIPVEIKIQRELKDLKSRESELKKIRKTRKSTPDLFHSIDHENGKDESDEEDFEHCYGPGKLRSVKSISELCISAQPHNSSSLTIDTPIPELNRNFLYDRQEIIRPAVSLAKLCDLDPEQAPSSHRLIAQWESLIQQNA